MDESQIAEIEAPTSLAPDLSIYGIQEVDRGVCADTYENRKIMRDNHLRWSDLYNSDGTPSGNLQVITTEMIEARVASKTPILSDPANINSDYLTGYMLLMETASDKLVPSWVIAATRHWNVVEQRREDTGERYRPALDSAPGRCIARRHDGSRCLNWHNGTASAGARCKYHMDRAGHDDVVNHTERARNRVISAAVAAADKLEQLLDAASEPVALKAATELLDRAGVRAGYEVDATVKTDAVDAGQLLAQRLKRLESSRPAQPTQIETVEAEVIEDEQH
jgi:hypothetical protein